MSLAAAPGWRPLLHGEAAAAARSAVAEIADALASEPIVDASLSAGAAGRALFFGYASQAWPERGFEALADAFLDRALALAASEALGPGLYGGYAGVGWVAEHLRRFPRWAEDVDPEDEIAGSLLDVLSRAPWDGDYDLIAGLAGFGVYALERGDRPAARALLDAVVGGLARTAEPGAPGVTWFTPPSLLRGEAREACPEGLHNLGIAHGVPGVIGLLAAAESAQASSVLGRSLLDGAVEWLLAQRLAQGGFAAWQPRAAGASSPARLAWCYGDPGVAAVLTVAAASRGSSAWSAAAGAIARGAAERPYGEGRVVDACICHGAAGLGHVFARIALATGDAALEDAARRGYEQALAYRRAGEPAGGYRASVRAVAGGPALRPADVSFLSGALGVGLALLSAAEPVEPAWDRLLLLSAPATSRRGAFEEMP